MATKEPRRGRAYLHVLIEDKLFSPPNVVQMSPLYFPYYISSTYKIGIYCTLNIPNSSFEACVCNGTKWLSTVYSWFPPSVLFETVKPEH